MKLIPLLLYLVSLGLFGLAGWIVYEMLSLRKDSVRVSVANDGSDFGHLPRVKSGGTAQDWNYRDGDWGAALRNVNLVGKLPTPPAEGGPGHAREASAVEPPPLGEIIELVSLVHDGDTNGRGGNTYVIVRYKPGADVKPPEWYIRESMSGPATTSGKARSAAAKPPGGDSPIPTAMAGRDIMQKICVVDDGDPRHGNRLWPTFDNIKLVGVSSDAQVAWFVRDLPPPKDGSRAPELKEEPLLKTSMHLSAELREELRRLQGRDAPVASSNGNTEPSPSPGNAWIDVPETKVVNGVTHISKKDEERFRDPDELLRQIDVDIYSGKSVKGLIVRSVDPGLGKTMGIEAGEVLIEINGHAVRSRSEALERGKDDYQRGVRTFTSKWLSNGAVIERTWQAPDR